MVFSDVFDGLLMVLIVVLSGFQPHWHLFGDCFATLLLTVYFKG